MANYSVVGPDGVSYGPVNETGLAQWVQAGRVAPDTAVSTDGAPPVPARTLIFLAPYFPSTTVPSLPPGANAATRHQLEQFSVPVAILLHYLTLGIFTLIWLNLLHGKMPQVRQDDPSAGKAIGFCFIPVYSLYWVFFTYHRLCVRINEQRAINKLPGAVPTGLAIAMCVMMVIPYVGVISFLILAPIFLGIVQSNVNELARAPQGVAR